MTPVRFWLALATSVGALPLLVTPAMAAPPSRGQVLCSPGVVTTLPDGSLPAGVSCSLRYWRDADGDAPGVAASGTCGPGVTASFAASGAGGTAQIQGSVGGLVADSCTVKISPSDGTSSLASGAASITIKTPAITVSRPPTFTLVVPSSAGDEVSVMDGGVPIAGASYSCEPVSPSVACPSSLTVNAATGAFEITAADIGDHRYRFVATFGGRQYRSQPATISVIAPPPPATSVLSVASVTEAGAYGQGAVIDIAVTFSDAVRAVATKHLKLALETGDDDAVATYVSGSGTSTLLFRYKVRAGDVAAALSATGIQSLQGTITSAATGKPVSLSLDGAQNIQDSKVIGVGAVAVAAATPSVSFDVPADPTFEAPGSAVQLSGGCSRPGGGAVSVRLLGKKGALATPDCVAGGHALGGVWSAEVDLSSARPGAVTLQSTLQVTSGSQRQSAPAILLLSKLNTPQAPAPGFADSLTAGSIIASMIAGSAFVSYEFNPEGGHTQYPSDDFKVSAEGLGKGGTGKSIEAGYAAERFGTETVGKIQIDAAQNSLASIRKAVIKIDAKFDAAPVEDYEFVELDFLWYDDWGDCTFSFDRWGSGPTLEFVKWGTGERMPTPFAVTSWVSYTATLDLDAGTSSVTATDGVATFTQSMACARDNPGSFWVGLWGTEQARIDNLDVSLTGPTQTACTPFIAPDIQGGRSSPDTRPSYWRIEADHYFVAAPFSPTATTGVDKVRVGLFNEKNAPLTGNFTVRLRPDVAGMPGAPIASVTIDESTITNPSPSRYDFDFGGVTVQAGSTYYLSFETDRPHVTGSDNTVALDSIFKDGRGIWESYDDGATWQQPYTGEEFDIQVHYTQPANVCEAPAPTVPQACVDTLSWPTTLTSCAQICSLFSGIGFQLENECINHWSTELQCGAGFGCSNG